MVGDRPVRYTFSRYNERGAVFMRKSRYIPATQPAYKNTPTAVILKEVGTGRRGGALAYEPASENASATSHLRVCEFRWAIESRPRGNFFNSAFSEFTAHIQRRQHRNTAVYDASIGSITLNISPVC